MSEWQPIETAPRDGTKFLGYSRTRKVRVDWYDRAVSARQFVHEPGIDLYTHWMPLPAPPTDQKEVMPNSGRPDNTRAASPPDNATPQPAHSPAGAEQAQRLRDQLNIASEFLCGLRHDTEAQKAWTAVLYVQSSLLIDFIEPATALAPPQVTDEMVERLDEWLRTNAATRITRGGLRDALTAAFKQ